MPLAQYACVCEKEDAVWALLADIDTVRCGQYCLYSSKHIWKDRMLTENIILCAFRQPDILLQPLQSRRDMRRNVPDRK